MAYCRVPDGMDFSTEFPTFVIGFCPDTNSIFVTNKRFWYAQYDKEFATEKEGIEFVEANWGLMLDWKNSLCEPEFPDLVNWIKLENTERIYDRIIVNDWQRRVLCEE